MAQPTPRARRTAAAKAQEALGLATRKHDRIEVALIKAETITGGLRADLAAAKVELDYAAANPALSQDALPDEASGTQGAPVLSVAKIVKGNDE